MYYSNLYLSIEKLIYHHNFDYINKHCFIQKFNGIHLSFPCKKTGNKDGSLSFDLGFKEFGPVEYASLSQRELYKAGIKS